MSDLSPPTSITNPAARRALSGRFAKGTRVPSRVLILLICGVLAGIGAALLDTVAAQQATRDQVARTDQILGLLRNALRTGLDAETGQRGFLLTGDESYLRPYLAAEDTWLADIDELERALEGLATDTQMEAIREMRELAAAKLAEQARTIELMREGRSDDARAVVLTDEGQRLMRDFRREVAALEDTEELILSAALTRAERVEARTLPILAILGATVLGLVVLGFWLERRTARAEADAREAVELRLAHERSDLLARELNHRVKNLFAVIMSIVSMSGRGETDVAVAVKKIRERIHALSLAHAVSTGQLEAKVVGLADVLRATLEPYTGRDAARGGMGGAPGRVTIEGPPVELPVKSVTPAGLIAHELATNATKYGALSRPDGTVAIRWDLEDAGAEGSRVRLVWTERGGPPAGGDQAEGFGSLMLRQAARQLGGGIERRWTPDGLEAELTFVLAPDLSAPT